MSIPFDSTVFSFSPYCGLAEAITSNPKAVLNKKYFTEDLKFEYPACM